MKHKLHRFLNYLHKFAVRREPETFEGFSRLWPAFWREVARITDALMYPQGHYWRDKDELSGTP